MPPIIAIVLALLTKEVYLSLFAGCALGALLVTGFHPWEAFDTLYNTMIDSADFSILMFMILLGMIVMLMQESGGTRAYGEWASARLKTKKSALIATSLLGVLIFVDDYFNCLTVGSVMRPVTDKNKISRAKLAYIIDATAAPICIIAPISSWAAAVNSYVPANSSMSGFEMFISTIPFNLYAILTLYMVFFVSTAGFDFGLMKKHEKNAENGDVFTSGGEAFTENKVTDPTEGGKYARGKVIDLIAPMIVMIVTAIGAMIWTGHLNGGTNLVENFANCSSSESLVFAGLVTIGFLLIFYLPRRVIGFKDFMNSVPEGGKLMMPAILILVLAWTLKGMTDALGIGEFVRSSISLSPGLVHFIPLIIFCIAIFIAFSSGTSWGTFAILVPIVINMFAESDQTMMIMSLRRMGIGKAEDQEIRTYRDIPFGSSYICR
jgi:tetracycline resistance efflux pump